MNEFGQRVRALRGKRGWSQDDLAREIGVSRNTVQSWEAGTMPRGAMLARLADALQSTVAILLDTPPVSTVAEAPSTFATAPLPSSVRLRENEIERELIEAGASDDQVRDFRRSVRESPLIAALFRGGAPDRVVSEHEMQLYEGVAIGFKAIVEVMIKEAKEARRR